MSNKKSFVNHLKLVFFAILLGAVTGTVIWAFLRSVGIGTNLLWKRLPEKFDIRGYRIVVCTVGGLIIGIFRKVFGDYPEELPVVMGKVKKDGHYDYSNMLVMLISAFLPLIFAASVGPEAGLTGVIVGLCYWVGDNIKYAKEHEREYSEVGEAVTLGVLFGAPLFGIFAVEEEGGAHSDFVMPKPAKLVLYSAAIAGGLIANGLLSRFFGQAMGGFPAFADVSMQTGDYVAMALYIVCGILLAGVFELCEKFAEKIAKTVPKVICETLCGLILGIVITCVPMVSFSGEEQMGGLMEEYTAYVPIVLIGVSLLKVLITTWCIQLGMKGGHFFPLIFACVCMGFGVGMLIFGYDLGHLAYAAGTVTAACLGVQMKKPFAVALLCLLCFPFKMIFFLFLAAAIGAWVTRDGKEHAGSGEG